ncbi:helix-turn-helix domain-containing protein [Mycolicibacterium farcinogenes]|nr:helix-turn-helix domain-containing protein [Mycolicibacterium farcinogenes]
MVVSDRTSGTEYLTTLQAFFEAGGDLSAAARALFIHRNTLKYRLTRIQEVFGIDIGDPVQRLVAELQVAAFLSNPDAEQRLQQTTVG